MMTVLATVICGVTCRLRSAFTKRRRDGVVGHGLDRDLDALRDFGRLVVLRRQARRREDPPLAGVLERGERDVEVERAVDRAERQADRRRGAAAAGRLTAVAALSLVPAPRGSVGPWRAARPRPPIEPLFGNARPVVLPICELARPLKPHWMPSARAKSRRGLDDARFDLDLRLRHVERARSAPAPSRADRAGPDDQRVGARVDLDLAARREHRLGQQRRRARQPWHS